MIEVYRYVAERDLEAYIQQGWQVWRLDGHHGARKWGAKTHLAWWRA